MQEKHCTNNIPSDSDLIVPYTRVQIQIGIGLLLVLAFLLMLFRPVLLYLGDPVSVRYSTIQLIEEGTINVNQSVVKKFGARGQYFFENVVSFVVIRLP